jgi:hypothetical protein
VFYSNAFGRKVIINLNAELMRKILLHHSGNEYQIGGPGSNRAIPRVTGFRAVGVERMIRGGEIKEATTIAALGLLRLKGLL